MQSESGPSLQKKRPTQQDVARLAGVSQATVSYVLNNRATVSVPPETRARVVAAMQELGYSDERIRKILGGNLLRVIRQVTEQ